MEIKDLGCDYDGFEEQFPSVFRIEPSSLCNLKCKHCPTGLSIGTEKGIMSWDTFKLILNEIKEFEPRVVVLYHGGEPFLNKRIFDMISELKKIGIGLVKIVTNGMLLTIDSIKKLINSGLDIIEFSLDGKTEKENDDIRVGSSYKTVSSLIKEFIKIKKNLNVKKPDIYIVNCQIPTEKELEEEIKVPDYISKDFSKYNDTDIKFKVGRAIYWSGMPIDTSLYKLITLSEGEYLNYCEHPIELITIRYNGDIVACCYDITSTCILGNIHESSIKEIWNNEKYRTLRKSIRNRKLLKLCKNCHIINPTCYIVRI